MRKNKSGFTLIELLVVIVIIGILVGITLFVYRGAQGRARDAQRKTDIANIAKAMELYYVDNGYYPPATGSTAINPYWAASNDLSWTTLNNLMVGANAIDNLPVDPKNSPTGSSVLTTNKSNQSYAIYVNTWNYCGSGIGQMYLIVYRLESGPKEGQSAGSPCNLSVNTTDIGPNYSTDYGVSYYRVVR
ncbi:MAG: prepilin-type N-terminal cleavage/methylation domain-containing protein [Candidatus Saccharibacteria bacterium]|nr:prepilin-type N-terminal cleavage/methylation domain-containing protein [Candidatus Saccharibacteria bacterium]MCA9339348.1 prepilin-type N-terminal cleavage/methylation domain-containing protein [Candidatus Saccharibacteria bacterium]